MQRICFSRFWLGPLAVGIAVATSACSDDFGLPPATVENRVDTTTLHALDGTSILLPSAYDVVVRSPVRTDLGEAFDFAFNITPQGTAQVLPAGMMGFAPQAGIAPMTAEFDAIVEAPDEGYVRDSAVAIQVGSVFVAQSRSASALCVFLGALPRYGKFRVLALDPVERSVQLEALVDVNCGYRSLLPGLPQR